MLFIETANNTLPTIILLHGGGLSNWSLSGVVELFQSDYHVITPIIDGHGENSNVDFISIEDSAVKLLEYIQKHHNGKVFAIGGLSLGAQIVTEVLSQKEDIAQYAILESALVLPMKIPASLISFIFNISYSWIKKKWFSKLQAKTLFISENMFEQYYADTIKMSKQSLINIMLSNTAYNLNENIEKTKATVLIIIGSKEVSAIKKSAAILKSKIPNSEVYCSQKMGHGELSVAQPTEYVKLLKNFFSNCEFYEEYGLCYSSFLELIVFRFF